MDLSFPHGMAVITNRSKDFYLGTDFVLTLPTIDHITNKIKQLGKGSLIYKVNISRVFCHIKIDPRDYFLLGLKHKNYYLDTCLPFGFRNRSRTFQRLSDAIRFIMKNMGYSNSNSNSIFIAPNLYPKTDSRCTKQKQKTVIINLRHSKGQRHGEK